jgi:exonuclease SbcC
MLPLKLSITGLYSYQKKQTIDFEELTNAGLFGIFWSSWFWKIFCFEAIGFVLYGDTERLNKTDKRSYNMLNLKSDKANIEFEFLNFEERKFKFVYWKKRFEETTSIERLAYEWKGEEWVPMTSADATEIIGLTYENFRRTIIIPQGSLRSFRLERQRAF